MFVRKVPFFDYPGLFAEYAEEYQATLRDVLTRGAYIMQSDLAQFEQDLAAYLGCRHAIGVADGTAAIVFSLKVSGISPEDEVIVSSHTFIATAAAVHHVGATPVVADCMADSMIDPDSVRRLIGPKTRALLPTQLNGRTCDMDALRAIADEYNLLIVEDSCQALGASYNGVKAGLMGIAGSYSFFPAKTLGCFGDGGAVVTNSDEVAETVRRLRDHGRGPDGKVREFGYNGRLDNIQAAILRLKLRHYDTWVARRRAIARHYHARLSGVAGLTLPPPPEENGVRFDIFQNYEIQAGKRDMLREHLTARGVGTIVQWGGWMLHQFDELNLRADAPYAERFSQRYMLLPMHHMLSDDDIDYVCDNIVAFY